MVRYLLLDEAFILVEPLSPIFAAILDDISGQSVF